MKTFDQIAKIEAVVLYILQSFKGGIDYIKLFKIMYFAQRKYLANYGRPIIDDTFRARMKGPVPSLTYKVIKLVEEGDDFSEYNDLCDFGKALNVDAGQIVSASGLPESDRIAEKERETLDWSISEHKDLDSDTLSELSHDDAYKKVLERIEDDPEKDVLTILDIAKAGGANESMVRYIREKERLKKALA